MCLYFYCIQAQMFHVHHFLGPHYFPTTSFRLCHSTFFFFTMQSQQIITLFFKLNYVFLVS
jgi:hypothetical protein